MDSGASFLKAWLAGTACVLAYAWVNLKLSPRLAQETAFTMTPDVTRLWDLLDWGGRLVHHGAFGLLALNAVAVGGILALGLRAAAAGLRRLQSPPEEPRVSIVPASVPTSVPPPAP